MLGRLFFFFLFIMFTLSVAYFVSPNFRHAT